MLKKITTLSLVGVFLLGPVAFAQTTTASTSGRGTSTLPSATSINRGSQVRKQNSACVQAAIDKRNAAISAGQAAFKKALNDARASRQTALKAVDQATSMTKTEKQAARKSVQKTYSDAAKAYNDAFRSARKAAEDQFNVDRKACAAAQKKR